MTQEKIVLREEHLVKFGFIKSGETDNEVIYGLGLVIVYDKKHKVFHCVGIKNPIETVNQLKALYLIHTGKSLPRIEY